MTAIAPAPAPAPAAGETAGRIGQLLRAREVGIAILIVVVVAITTLHNHEFLSQNSIEQLFSGAALIALLGVGETMVIVTRNVDLSVGSVLGLSAYVVGDLFKYHHIPVWSGFAVGILVGVVCGAVNGFVVSVLRVPSLVVTLGMLYVIRGIDGVIVNGDRIDPESIPNGFVAVGYKDLFGIPWLAIIVAVIVAIAGYAMRSYRSSRDLYAIGSNPAAAELAGIPIQRRVFSAFLISGALAGAAGALFLAQHTQIDNSGGLGYELTVVAACVVGGVAIFGGSGTVVGAALGALLLNTINQALVASRISAFWNMAIAGALLLAAIAFDRWLLWRNTRKAQSAEGAHREL
jgi:rhamnose transport system permease protein